jgi:hypothetical protein
MVGTSASPLTITEWALVSPDLQHASDIDATNDQDPHPACISSAIGVPALASST